MCCRGFIENLQRTGSIAELHRTGSREWKISMFVFHSSCVLLSPLIQFPLPSLYSCHSAHAPAPFHGLTQSLGIPLSQYLEEEAHWSVSELRLQVTGQTSICLKQETLLGAVNSSKLGQIKLFMRFLLPGLW